MTNQEAMQTLTEIFIVACMAASSPEKAAKYNEALQIAHKCIEQQIRGEAHE